MVLMLTTHSSRDGDILSDQTMQFSAGVDALGPDIETQFVEHVRQHRPDHHLVFHDQHGSLQVLLRGHTENLQSKMPFYKDSRKSCKTDR
jgi:hypothetical protein